MKKYETAIAAVREAYEEAYANETYINRSQAAYNAADNAAFWHALNAYGLISWKIDHEGLRKHEAEVMGLRRSLLKAAGL